MTDSIVVLNGQTWAYTMYCLALILMMGWFAFKITRKSKESKVSSALFYSFVTMLVILGVSLHIVTYNTIPWAAMDLNRHEIKADTTFYITVENHQFILPASRMTVNLHDKVLFEVTSNDLTYGFGVFRSDNSMMFQMQVVPGHRNDILWQFDKAGIYTIRSTEYSGPEGYNMVAKDVVEVLDITASAE